MVCHNFNKQMKYFIVSDIHSFYKEFRDGLKEAKFNKRNKEHTLVVLGDVFDRGPESVELYKYLKTIPKKRLILIRGNHELLYLELLNKKFPELYDFSNHTVDTFCQIANKNIDLLSEQYYGYHYNEYVIKSREAWSDIVMAVKNDEITKWIQSTEWKNYFELDKYIFVHSFLPTHPTEEAIKALGNYAYGTENSKYLQISENWRDATNAEWEDATWGCPWEQYKNGLFKPEKDKGKVLVCGHWHTSDFYKNLDGITEQENDVGPIYFSEGLIGMDGGCYYHPFWGYKHPQNVMVIDDSDFNTCYDKNGYQLVECYPKFDIETVLVFK